jgi:phage shock protein C
MKKLYRSRKDSKIAGICGGIAEYFNIDSNIVRLLTALTIFFVGGGFIVYLVAWLIIPLEPIDAETSSYKKTTSQKQEDSQTVVDAEIVEDSYTKDNED